MGVQKPAISGIIVWLIAIIIFIGCLLWSSVTWLHEQGIRLEMQQMPSSPERPPPALEQTAAGLPKI
jgi:hypothetical protein